MALTKEQVQAAWAKAEADLMSGGGGYMKLGKDANVVRMLPAADGSPIPFQKYTRYIVPIGTKTHYLTDLDAVYADPAMLDAALASRKITEADVKLIERYGMPFAKLRKAMFAAGVKYQDMPRGVKNETRLLWNVIDVANEPDLDKARPKVLETPQSVFTKIKGLVTGQYPDLFSPTEGRSVDIQGNGKDGRDRRYENVTPAPDRTPIPEAVLGKANDLVKEALRNVVSYREVVGIFLEAFGDKAKEFDVEVAPIDSGPAVQPAVADAAVPAAAADVAEGFEGLS